MGVTASGKELGSKRLKRLICLVLMAGMVISLLSGCGLKSDEMTAGEKHGNRWQGKGELLVIRQEGGDWGYPTPFAHYPRGPGGYKMRLIFDSLLERDEEGLIPWLAEEWKVENGGRDYLFTLKKGVRWHDGEPMTAEDVKFTFEYMGQYPPVWNDLMIEGKNFIDKVEMVGEDRVKITVEQTNATHLARLGTVPIVPKHIWEKVEEPAKYLAPESVVGCGPYTLEAYNKEQGLYRFKAFEEYWGPRPQVDAIEYVPVSDGVLAFEKGEIDLVEITPDILERYQNQKEFQILKNPGFWGYRLIFNMQQCPEFQNVQMRQAIAYGVDREELVEKVARGAAVPASAGYLPVHHIWYNKDVKDYSFNPEKAMQLMDGKKLSLELLIGNSKNELRIGELLKISLGKIGVEISVKSVDMKARDSAVKEGKYQLALIGHGGWGQDADTLREIYGITNSGNKSPSSGGIPGFVHSEIQQLCQLQMMEMDVQKRKKMIFQLQELIAEEVPILPLYNTTDYVVYRREKYDGWMYMFDHHSVAHSKLSYLARP